jgi:multimeric flavodoxin WrbA
MKAIAICGSPRTGGNTELLLERCLAVLQDHHIGTELIRLAECWVEPCRACSACIDNRNNACVMTDDDFPMVYGKMLEADIIVVGSPVHFGSATPQTMALLDRAGYVARANGNPLSRKMGGPIVVARRAGQNFTFAQLLLWYMINGLIVPGSTYWNIAFGRAAGDVDNDAEGLDTVTHFAENLAWLAAKLQ